MTSESLGFWAFYRQYTHSGIHTAATAALTAVGLLVFVHWSFAILAITIYILPPIVLYLYTDPEAEQSADSEPTQTQIEHGHELGRTEYLADEIVEEQASTTNRPKKAADGKDNQGERTERIGPVPQTEATDSEGGIDTDAEGDTTPSERDSTTADLTVETGGGRSANRAWRKATSPTDEELCDIVMADDGPYIIGDEGSILARRDNWEVVLAHGPTTNSNALYGAAVSADSRHVWVAGDSGVLGLYDTATSLFTDYSAPRGITNNWADIAAVGPSDKETLYVVDDSGQVLRGVNNSGKMTWDDPQTPGDGSSITSVVFIESAGYVCDTNACVYETTNDGDTWEQIGIENAGPDFTDIAPVRQDAITVTCDDGTVFRYDGVNWTNSYIGEESLCAIDQTVDTGLLCGEDGAIYNLGPRGWERESTPIEETLQGIAIGTTYPSVAVGEDGIILEYVE